MVLPPPAPDLEEGARAPVERLLRLLTLGHGGTLLLAVGGGAWVGRLWWGLRAAGHVVHAAADPLALLAAPLGSVVLFVMRGQDADWLNVHRPLFVDRGLRVVILAASADVRAVRRGAKDFYDWISHTVRLPEAPPIHVVRSLEAGLRDRIGWRGEGLRDVLPWVTSAPSREVVASRPMSEWADDREYPGVLIVRDVADAWAAGWVRRGSGGRGGLVYLDAGPVGVPVVSLEMEGWREASARLAAGGVASPMSVAAALGLEAEAIDAALIGAAFDLDQEDPAGGWARSTGHRDGALGRRVFPVEAVPETAAPMRTVEDAWRGFDRGRTAEAVVFAEVELGRAEGVETWAWLRFLAAARAVLGDQRGAVSMAERAIALAREGVRGHPERTADLLRLAVSCKELGNLQEELGNGSAARRLYEEGHAIEGRLVGCEPGRLYLKHNLSGSYLKLAELHRRLGDGVEAGRLYKLALDLATRTAQGEPGRADYQRALAVASDRLADRRLELGDTTEAGRLYEHALDVARGIAEGEPDSAAEQSTLSIAYVKLARLHLDLGETAEARRLSELGLDIARRLAQAERARVDYQRGLYVWYALLTDLHLRIGDGPEAARLGGLGLDIMRRLVELAPDRADYQSDLARSYRLLAQVYFEGGDRPEAKRLHELSLDIIRRALHAEPGRGDYQRDIAFSCERMAALAPAEAARWLEEAVPIRRALLAMDPSNALLRRELATSLLQYAGIVGAAEPLNEGARLLVELRREGVLKARYWPLADELAKMLADRE